MVKDIHKQAVNDKKKIHTRRKNAIVNNVPINRMECDGGEEAHKKDNTVG